MAQLITKGRPVSFPRLDKDAPDTIVTIDLTWTSRTDVDLGMMIEFNDGTTRVVQALGKDFGSLDSEPYIWLSGDDRRGGHEQLKLDLARMGNVRRAMAIAFIYRGFGGWKRVGEAKVTIHHPTQGDFEIVLGKNGGKSCALVDFRSDDAGGLSMERLGEFFPGYHQDIDQFYKWPNINWVAGRKD